MASPARQPWRSKRLLLAALLLAGPAWAGDEVNYSAPYLTLEDGKLVTKYPAKPHVKAAPETAAGTAAEPVPAREGLPTPVLVAVLIPAFAAAAALLLRWRRKKKTPGA